MDLAEWAHHFLIRNSKLKGWTVTGSGPTYTVEAKKTQRYAVSENLENAPQADVLITLNTKKNLGFAASHFDELPEMRILFANPTADAYWTLNIRMLRTFGDAKRFCKHPEAFTSEVPLV
jgi:hypothetical protein